MIWHSYYADCVILNFWTVAMENVKVKEFVLRISALWYEQKRGNCSTWKL